MLFLPDQADTSITVLPLKLTELTSEEPSSKEVVDWEFIEMIVSKGEGVKLGIVPDEERKGFQFKEEDYKDAVIMPWYRYAHLHFFTENFSTTFLFGTKESKATIRINIYCLAVPFSLKWIELK